MRGGKGYRKLHFKVWINVAETEQKESKRGWVWTSPRTLISVGIHILSSLCWTEARYQWTVKL